MTGPERRHYYADEEPANCEWCGKPLPRIRHWRTLFCDKVCTNAYFNNLTAEARAESRAKLVCHACGKLIENARRKDQKYHKACANRRRRGL